MQSNDPVAMTVHEVSPPANFKRRGRLTMFLVLLACVAPVLVSYFLYFVVRPGARSNYSTLIQPTVTLPADLGLSTLDGVAVNATQLKGQWLLLVVAGAACDARCEALLFEQRQLREMTGREKDRIDRVWLVPDDGAVREPMLKALQSGTPGWVLRVPRAKLEAWLQPESGRTLEDHLYIVDPMGEWMMRTPAAPEPQRLRKDLDRLLKASAFWDRPGRGL